MPGGADRSIWEPVRLQPARSKSSGSSAPVVSGKPICVDLDGTLIRTDSLGETVLSIFSNLGGLASLLPSLLASRASFKQQVALVGNLDPELLPYNIELLAYLREMKRKGRTIVLATAADARTARLVADHLGIFDEVIASDGNRNLKGEEKARELVRRFGRKGFEYVGNDHADIAVWREADGIVVANASPSVSKKAQALGKIVELSSRPPLLPALLRAMRPHQWVKNILVFVPLLASHSFDDLPSVLGALAMFASFCATASAIYIINDLLDLSADRRHPRKRNRPFASGSLPLDFGAMAAGVLVAIGIALAELVDATAIILIYALLSLGYSLRLKQFPLLDVFILAGLYTIRVIAGGVASGHAVSLWLLAFSGFTFLSLAFVKRTAEMPHFAATSSEPKATRRGYLPDDRPVLQNYGISSSFASSIVLALFVGSPAALEQYGSPEMLWGLVPLILFWQLRLWLSTSRGHMHDDPIVYAARDWVSWLVAVNVIGIVVLASWTPGIL